MKYCEEYAALLDQFVDGELPGPELERVRAHLEVCPGCRAYVDDALAIRAGFPDVEETAVPEGFAEGVMERIRAESAGERKTIELRRRAARRWTGTLGLLAACCALVVLVRTGGGFAAPAGDGAAYDTAAVTESEAAEAAPQMAPASPEKKEEESPETFENRAASRGVGVKKYQFEQARDEAAALPAPASAAPEAFMEDAASEKKAALYLTEEEAGDLLDGYTVVWENGVEWCYELDAEEYQALLEALGRREELPETADGPFLVVVAGPNE